MKTEKTPTINLNQELELQYVPDFQTGVFTVTGEAEAVLPIADDIQALEATVPKPERTRKLAMTVIEAVEAPVKRGMGQLATRIATDVTAALYDRRNGTQFLSALREKRQTEKDLLMADKLGLLSVQPCAKHRHYLDEVRKIR